GGAGGPRSRPLSADVAGHRRSHFCHDDRMPRRLYEGACAPPCSISPCRLGASRCVPPRRATWRGYWSYVRARRLNGMIVACVICRIFCVPATQSWSTTPRGYRLPGGGG